MRSETDNERYQMSVADLTDRASVLSVWQNKNADYTCLRRPDSPDHHWDIQRSHKPATQCWTDREPTECHGTLDVYYFRGVETLAVRLTVYDRLCIPTSTTALTRGTYNRVWHQTVKEIPQKPCRKALSKDENTSPIACVGIASPALTTGEDADRPWVDAPLG
jgi:hypothetical protein